MYCIKLYQLVASIQLKVCLIIWNECAKKHVSNFHCFFFLLFFFFFFIRWRALNPAYLWNIFICDILFSNYGINIWVWWTLVYLSPGKNSKFSEAHIRRIAILTKWVTWCIPEVGVKPTAFMSEDSSPLTVPL